MSAPTVTTGRPSWPWSLLTGKTAKGLEPSFPIQRVIESIPVDPDDMYTKKIIWICKYGLIAVKAEYYDREGLLKIFTAHDIKQQDSFWTIFRTEMENIPEKHKTIMKIEEIHYNAGLKDSLFRVSKLQRGA